MKKLRQSLNINCSSCPVASLCIAKGLDQEALQWLNKEILNYQVFEVGEHLFRKEDNIDYVFAIRCGAVKTYQMSKKGEEFMGTSKNEIF